tara:strand:+ start:10132 stop:10311 length:180 start_codon:yes stop_codon:yes gene_type:complete
LIFHLAFCRVFSFWVERQSQNVFLKLVTFERGDVFSSPLGFSIFFSIPTDVQDNLDLTG